MQRRKIMKNVFYLGWLIVGAFLFTACPTVDIEAIFERDDNLDADTDFYATDGDTNPVYCADGTVAGPNGCGSEDTDQTICADGTVAGPNGCNA
jgi:hypothetical protein